MVLALAAIQRGDHRRLPDLAARHRAVRPDVHRRPGLRVHRVLPRGPAPRHQPVRLDASSCSPASTARTSRSASSGCCRCGAARCRAGCRPEHAEARRDRRSVLALRRRRVDRHLHRHLPDPEVGADDRSKRRGRRGDHRARRRARDRASRGAPARARSATSRARACCRASSGRTPTPRPVRASIAVMLVVITALEIAVSYLEGTITRRAHRRAAARAWPFVKFFLVAVLVHAPAHRPAGLPALLHHRHRRRAIVLYVIVLLMFSSTVLKLVRPGVLGASPSRLAAAPRRVAARRAARRRVRDRARRGSARGSRPARPVVTRFQVACFSLGVLAMWLASDWPIHDLAERYLYSVHMVQHLTFTMVAAPLLLLGTPAWLLRWLLRPPLAAAHGAHAGAVHPRAARCSTSCSSSRTGRAMVNASLALRRSCTSRCTRCCSSRRSSCGCRS